MEKFIVSRDENIYEAWPDVVLADNGELICVFSECEHHGNRNLARLCVVTSKDKGRHWSDKTYLTSRGVKTDYFNCARISKHRDGTLYIVCDRIVGGDEDVRENTLSYLWKSEDNGKSWSDAKKLPVNGIVPDRLLELKCGRWLVAVHTRNTQTGKLCQYVYYSDDKGESWSGPREVANDKRYNLCEASIIETSSGELICFMRENSGKGYDCMKAISYDKGETWQGVFEVPLPGCHRPTAGYLEDGSIFVTYRFFQGGCGFFGSYQNVFGALMSEESAKETLRNKQSTRIFPLAYDRNPKADTGYTGWVQFPDGEIFVVNYIMDDADKAWIQAISLKI